MQDITIIKHLTFANLLNIIIFLGIYIYFKIVIEFQNCESEHNHGLLWIKNAPMYGVHTNEEIEQFIEMYISCDVSLLPNPVQNAQQHQHTHMCKKKKTMLFIIYVMFICGLEI